MTSWCVLTGNDLTGFNTLVSLNWCGLQVQTRRWVPISGSSLLPPVSCMLMTSKLLSLRESTATSELLTHILKMSWYPHPNLDADGTKLNKLATLDFFFVGILIPWFASICAKRVCLCAVEDFQIISLDCEFSSMHVFECRKKLLSTIYFFVQNKRYF